ncbi:MAG: hypothetical protein A2Y12_07810 [Planctomycetes bacterium GWF2_42_9]|nr:MAG: hypothetical protein A2Y12_07810 [Planctomycetes bacterium GWF2_42_9]
MKNAISITKIVLLTMIFAACGFLSGCGENHSNCNYYGAGGDYWDTPLYHCHCPGSPEKIRRRCGVVTNKRYRYADKSYESQVDRYQQNEHR